MPLDLPHPASTPVTERMAGDSTWAATYKSPPLPPMTILGMSTLQHPCPQLAQASSGTILPFHTVPTSPPPTTAPPTTEPLHQRQSTNRNEGLPQYGTSPYSIASSHPSLYEQSRHPSPVPQPPFSGAPTGGTSRIGTPPTPQINPCDLPPGSDSPGDSESDHNLHQSYSRPLSCDMGAGQVSQATPQPPSTPLVLQHHGQRSLSMESQRVPSRPLSHHSCQTTPNLPEMTLTEAIHFYERTATDLSVAIPAALKQADYQSLYAYFIYELPFVLAWGDTQAGNDYFINKQKGLPADKILQYEAAQTARLLYNKLHQSTPMEEFAPYEEVIKEVDIQPPMPDEPPVPPPRAPITAFSYIRGHEPPGTFSTGYRPFAGRGHGAGQPPPQPQPPAAPQQWALPHHPAPPKAPTPPAPWQLTNGHVTPYNDFKPKILKEVDDFHGDSNNISRFFLKCELHFEVFNRHFRYPPPQSNLLHLATRWRCTKVVGVKRQAFRKECRWGVIIPHLYGL